MHFYIDPIELMRILKKLCLRQKAAGQYVWVDSDKYNEVSFKNAKVAITIKTQVILSGRIRINKENLIGLETCMKFTDRIEFITEDPFLLIKQEGSLTKFDYQTQWLLEQRTEIKKEQKRLAKEQTKINKQLRDSKKQS